MERTCLNCPNQFHTCKSLDQRYCSRTCYTERRKATGEYQAWNRGMKMAESLRLQMTGQNNSRWKGDNAGYSAKHKWVTRHYGKAKTCENCGNTEASKYEWANLSKLYLRDIEDWMQLCKSCHVKLDRYKSITIDKRTVSC